MGCKTCEKPKASSRKGLWSPEEDQKLRDYILAYGHSCWSSVPAKAGLQRNGKSCRLRWINYLRPGLKHGVFSTEEEATVMKLHQVLGNKWSRIAMHLPGRTDNEIKNYWNSHLKKKATKAKGSSPHAQPRPFPGDLIKHASPSEITSDRTESSSIDSSQQSTDHVCRSHGSSAGAKQLILLPVIFEDWLPVRDHAALQQSTACSGSTNAVNWRCGSNLAEANASGLLEVVVSRKHEMVHGFKDTDIYRELQSQLEHGEHVMHGGFDDHIFSMDETGGGSFGLEDHNLFFDENYNLIY